MLATCANCAHTESGRCSLNAAPAAGDVLCNRYEMDTPFRDEVVRRALADIRDEINLAIVKHKAAKSAMFAG